MKEAERREPTGDASAAATEGQNVEEEKKKEETKQTLKQDAEVKDEKSGKKLKN